MRRLAVLGFTSLAALFAKPAFGDANIKALYQFASVGVSQLGTSSRISSALGGEFQGEYEIDKGLLLTAHYSIAMADVSNLMLYGYGIGVRYLVLGQGPILISDGLNEYSYSPGYNLGITAGMLRRDFDFRAFDKTKEDVLVKGKRPVTQGDFWAPYLGVEVNFALVGSLRGSVGARFGYALFGELKSVKIDVVSVLAGVEVQL